MELAREAIALLREVIAHEDRSVRMSGDRALAMGSICLHLLVECANPEDVTYELRRIDSLMAQQLGDALLAGIDFDQLLASE